MGTGAALVGYKQAGGEAPPLLVEVKALVGQVQALAKQVDQAVRATAHRFNVHVDDSKAGANVLGMLNTFRKVSHSDSRQAGRRASTTGPVIQIYWPWLTGGARWLAAGCVTWQAVAASVAKASASSQAQPAPAKPQPPAPTKRMAQYLRSSSGPAALGA